MTIDDRGRPEPELAADERTTLLGFLDYQRATLAWKTRALGSEGLAATVGASQEEVRAGWEAAVARARAMVDRALADS